MRRVNIEELRKQQNWIDRAIETVAPVWGAKRFAARVTMAAAGGYVGGSKNRRSMESWQTTNHDPDSDILPDLPTLRERSRDLQRNNALAAGALNTKITNVIGTGLKPQCNIDAEFLGMTEDQADAWEKQTEREFLLWAESKDCDIERTSNFFELQTMVYTQHLVNGDVFVLLPFKPAGTISILPYDLRVQVIEADRVCNPKFAMDVPTLAGGVEKEENGAPLAYHILRHHPGSVYGFQFEWDRIPAFGAKTGRRNVHHLFKKDRPGQSRGVPDLTPVIEALKQLGDYTENEIEAAAVSAMFTVFVTAPAGEGLAPAQSASGQTTTTKNSEYNMGPAAMLDLMPGEDVKFADPTRPNPAYDPFVTAILRQIGVGLNLPFEVLIKHFMSSYTAARAALQEAWKYFSTERRWLNDNFCQPVYESWLEESVASGRTYAPGFFADPIIRKAYCRVKWIGPARGLINEVQEITAANDRVNMSISTLEDESIQITGECWEPKLRQRAKEVKLLKDAGLFIAAPTQVNAQEDPNAEPQPDQQDQKDQKNNDN
jgi:lambda family phage portal protein